MAKEMLINVSEGEECRIALLEDGKLEELYMERTSSTSHVGNIYKGRVTNVEPSIQAAFVDFGLGRNGFLHISDLMPSYFGHKGDMTEAVGRKMSRRDRPPIQRCLRRGDDITVQIIKEGIGTKGPTLTTYLSIPGRILVMMPGMSRFGISRKIEDDEERRRLRGILDGLKPIDEVGFIIRTAGVGKNKTEIERDLKYLTRLWENISKKMKEPAPVELYTEGDLVTRTVRDVFTSDITQIVVDNKDVAKRIKEFFKIAMPRTKNKVEFYDEPIPLFHKHRIEEEIERMYSRHVPLPSGGSLVIDSTEAVVAIDVNSGKFRDHSDAEMTAFKTDMEAADEIPRQLRLRDLGGVIICDFIDLRFERNRRELEKQLHDNLRDDRAKTKVLRMSQFGIIEMTRQRMRPSLKRSIYFDCPHCKGSGLVKTPESMSLDVMRKLAIGINDQRVARVDLAVCPDVALYLLNKKRAQLAVLEDETHKKINIRHDAQLGLDEMKLTLYDIREGLVFIDALGMSPHDTTTPIHGRGTGSHQQGRHDNRGRGGRNDNRNRGGRQDNRNRNDDRNRNQNQEHSPEEDRFEMENVEDAVEQREQQHASERANPPAPVFPSAPTTTAASKRTRNEPPVDDEESNVIDVEEAVEPMGDAPEAVEDDRDRRDGGDQGGRRRRRGRRGRGRGGRDRQENGGGSNNRPPQGSGGDNRQPQGDRPASNRPAPSNRPPQGGRRDRVGTKVVDDHRPDPGNEALPPEVDEIETDEPSPGNERGPGEAELVAEGDQPAKKRRRRRGGRRHRRRREQQAGENAPAEIGGDEVNAPQDDEPAVEQPVTDDEAEETEETPEVEPVAEVKPRQSSSRGRRQVEAEPPAPARIPPPRPPEPPVVRTGSTDKHLIPDVDEEIDEPVLHEPVRRPRTYRDLDAIPDDLD